MPFKFGISWRLAAANIQVATVYSFFEVVGAEADDTEAEFIRGICEKRSVTGDNLLSQLVPVISEICLNSAKYSNPKLKSAASLALAKFMLVSSEFCEDNLQVFFTLLEKSPEPVIRANLIVAAGDLSFRFPNTLEPWTPRMYACLRDASPLVRSNTLTVLTHLILNDMIKVRLFWPFSLLKRFSGQVGRMNVLSSVSIATGSSGDETILLTCFIVS